MSLVDDLLTAAVGAGGAIVGGWLGARATRRASIEAFERLAIRDAERWRQALDEECLETLNHAKELGNRMGEQWEVQHEVLDQVAANAFAFTPEIRQHVRWALTWLQRANQSAGTIELDSLGAFIAEIQQIEVALRPPPTQFPAGTRRMWLRAVRSRVAGILHS